MSRDAFAVEPASRLPDRFDLPFADDAVQRCAVRWRKRSEMGVNCDAERNA